MSPRSQQQQRNDPAGWALPRVLLILAGGVILTVGATAIADALDLDPVGQRVVAVVCLAAVLVTVVLGGGVREEHPLTVVATCIAIAVAILGALTFIGSVEEEPALGCINTEGALDATVSGETAVIYSEATAASDPKGLLVRGCRIRPVGYCLGAVHRDAIEVNVLDIRWLILPDDQGLVANGRTVGPNLAPRQPQDCPGGVDAPDEVAFAAATMDATRRTVALRARAPRAAFIGFAIQRDGERWERVGWDPTPEDDAPLNAPLPPDASPGDEIVATACIGFEHPSNVIGRARLRRGRAEPTKLPLVRQPVADRPQDAACNAAIPPPGPS